MEEFFTGDWKGKGEFSNGSPIEVNISFKSKLEGAWLVSEHIDLPPNNYKSFATWGYDNNNDFYAYIFDNYKGHRKFESTGWNNDNLILINNTAGPDGKYFERFIYTRNNSESFKMVYEVSQDSTKWKMIDYLVFEKQTDN